MRILFGAALLILLMGASWSSTPNIFGGYNYRGPNGQYWSSQSNIFGGHNYRSRDGRRFSTRSNIFGGYNYYGDFNNSLDKRRR